MCEGSTSTWSITEPLWEAGEHGAAHVEKAHMMLEPQQVARQLANLHFERGAPVILKLIL